MLFILKGLNCAHFKLSEPYDRNISVQLSRYIDSILTVHLVRHIVANLAIDSIIKHLNATQLS